MSNPTPNPTANRFDRDTAVAPLGDGVYEARFDTGWWVVRGPNGGYVAAILLRALEAAVGDAERAARSLTIHYTAPPAQGPARIETRIERRGRHLTSVSCRMHQGGRLLALALGAFSRPREAYGFSENAMPETKPPEDCAPLEPRIPIHARFEQRWAVGSPPFSGGAHALCGGWIRLAEAPRRPDTALIAAYADAWPPAIFSRTSDSVLAGGVPTIDLSIHFRAPLPQAVQAPDDFCLCLFRSQRANEGFVEEDGEVWSRDGVLIAQSRQLALVL